MQNNQFKSIYGFILSIALYIICIVTSIPTIKDYLYKTNPKIIYEESVTNDKSYVNNTNLEMFLQFSYWDIQKSNLANLSEDEIEEAPSINFLIRNNSGYYPDLTTKTHMERCKNLPNFKDILSKDINSESIDVPSLYINSFCFPNNYNSFLETKNLEDRALVITLHKSYGKLSAKYPFFIIQFYYKDVLINPSNKLKPYTKLWTSIGMNVKAFTYTYWNLVLRKSEYIINPSSFLFKSDGVRFEELQVEKLFPTINTKTADTFEEWDENLHHLQIYISKNPKQSTNTISLVSFDDCLATFGGVFSILHLLFEGIAGFILCPFLETQQINSAFKFHYHSKDSKEIRKKDLILKKTESSQLIANNLSNNLFITNEKLIYKKNKNFEEKQKINIEFNKNTRDLTNVESNNFISEQAKRNNGDKSLKSNRFTNTTNKMEQSCKNENNNECNYDSVNINLNLENITKTKILEKNYNEKIDQKSDLDIISSNNLNIEMIDMEIDNPTIDEKNESSNTSSNDKSTSNKKEELLQSKLTINKNFSLDKFLSLSQKSRINQYLSSIDIIENKKISYQDSSKIDDENNQNNDNNDKELNYNKISLNGKVLKSDNFNQLNKILNEFIEKTRKDKVFTVTEIIKANFKAYFNFNLNSTDKILLNCLEIQGRFLSLENLNNLSLDNIIIKQMISDERLECLLSFLSLNLESEETENLLKNLSTQYSSFDEKNKVFNRGLIDYSISLKNKDKILGNYLKNYL